MGSASKSWTGGARIGGGGTEGGISATYPFAKLTASEQSIILSIRYFVEQEYVFNSNTVIGVEPYGFLPFIATGIRINHLVIDIPKDVIFWVAAASPKRLLSELKAMGYSV